MNCTLFCWQLTYHRFREKSTLSPACAFLDIARNAGCEHVTSILGLLTKLMALWRLPSSNQVSVKRFARLPILISRDLLDRGPQAKDSCYVHGSYAASTSAVSRRNPRRTLSAADLPPQRTLGLRTALGNASKITYAFQRLPASLNDPHAR